MFSTDPVVSATEAGLRYVSAGALCIRRVRRGRFFGYVGPRDRRVRDPKQLKRIRSLVIPPAWRDVRICGSPQGHLQAVGWDAKGRKQYRYHPRYRAARDQAKFSRLLAFGTLLARIRQSVRADLGLRGLPKQKVIAVVVRLLETVFLRIGNDEYARANESFGLTTLRNRHVAIDGARLMFRFRGKSGQDQCVQLTDARLAHIVQQCRDLPGYDLFEYESPSGAICRINSSDVNNYIRDASGQEFTAKDFRTWAGTVLAVRELYTAGPAPDATAAKKTIVEAIKRVAAGLGNRPATCRKYYIHPAILEAYEDGSLHTTMERGIEQDNAYAGLGLSAEEYAVMVIVARYQEKLAKDLRARAA